jgi:GMP synthase (glutamine-hydrolysing)
MSRGEVYSLTEGVVSPVKDPEAFLKQAYDWVKNRVHANEKVGLALSGGIDSTVVASILRDSIGENLYPMHMDHGFMRLIEGEEESGIVIGMFSDYPNLIYKNDVRERFYNAVEGIEDGDRKRAAFREVYKDVLHESMEPLDCVWTSDGTIKPDIRETRGGIKLQHNVDLGFAQKKLEPLAALSKQEVRALAKYLGIPHLRQPFPGPGLLVRIVGAYSPEKLAVEKEANDIVEQRYKEFMLRHWGKEMIIDGETGMQIPFQTFAATFDYKEPERKKKWLARFKIIPEPPKIDTKVTGLVDDGYKYGRIYKIPVLTPMRSSVYNYVIANKGTERLLCLLDERKHGDFIVAIRAIDSIDVKKCIPNVSGAVPEIIAKDILGKIPEVKSVYFDITAKPPATVEYE